jgi:amino acid transporter
VICQVNNQRDTGQAAGAPSPDALFPALDESQIAALRQVGHEWDRACGDPCTWQRALPVDQDLGSYDAAQFRPTRFGRFVPVAGLGGQPSAVEATSEAEEPPSRLGRLDYRLRRTLLGPPLGATAIAVERMRKLVALPILSADALSSVAYGPEAMLAILVLGGSAGLSYSLPVSAGIVFLMLSVGVSYRQTIRAYPHGGGSYIVATDNLGRVPGLIAAAGLLTDYIMTVAVSVSSGVAAITSAIPSFTSAVVPIGAAVIAVLLAGNLRGIRQAGALFAAPTYAFIIAIFALVASGLIDAGSRGFHSTPTPRLAATGAVSTLLVLRAFSSGSTAMTGIEAVSNAVPAFKPVEWRNARATLTWMVALLITMFAGIIALVRFDGVVPNGKETVLSQLAHRSFGSGAIYVYIQAATAAVLLLAANTAYNDFPRVLFLLARSYHAPRLFLRIGDRLAFSNGIIALSVISVAIYITFGGNTLSLIPLYAVGVFLAFTMSQAGMVVHWWRHRDPHWRKSLAFNATGGILSAIVFITAGITKFAQGAWVAVLAIGFFVLVALRIRRHYDLVSEAIALHPGAIEVPASAPLTPGSDAAAAHRHTEADGHNADGHNAAPPSQDGEQAEQEENPTVIQNLTIVPLAGMNLPGMRALAYAVSLRHPVLALHISPTDDEANRFRAYWHTWGDHLPLEVIVSPHRAIVAPLINYIAALHHQRPALTLTVIFPEIVVRHWWQRILHSQTAPRLRRALRPLPKIVVTSIPFHLSR